MEAPPGTPSNLKDLYAKGQKRERRKKNIYDPSSPEGRKAAKKAEQRAEKRVIKGLSSLSVYNQSKVLALTGQLATPAPTSTDQSSVSTLPSTPAKKIESYMSPAPAVKKKDKSVEGDDSSSDSLSSSSASSLSSSSSSDSDSSSSLSKRRSKNTPSKSHHKSKTTRKISEFSSLERSSPGVFMTAMRTRRCTPPDGKAQSLGSVFSGKHCWAFYEAIEERLVTSSDGKSDNWPILSSYIDLLISEFNKLATSSLSDEALRAAWAGKKQKLLNTTTLWERARDTVAVAKPTKPDTVCTYCDKPGHTKSACWKRKAENKKQKEQEEEKEKSDAKSSNPSSGSSSGSHSKKSK